MPTPSTPVKSQADHERAIWLKEQLRQFAAAGPLKEVFQQYRNNSELFETSDPADENEAQSVLDWFVYDWFDETGYSVIDHFVEERADLTDRDRDILDDWHDSINSVFEIQSLADRKLRLRDLDGGDEFTVTTLTSLKKWPLKSGQYIVARLLPLGKGFIFAGPQFIMPDRKAADEALDMVRAFEHLGSPEALEQAQREQCAAFCEVFGCAELSVTPDRLNATLERLQQYLFFERRDPQTNQTPAEQLKAECGHELKLVDLPPTPAVFEGVSEITLLCDEFDGIVILPDYARLKAVFATDDPDRDVPGWEELVWNYVEHPDLPLVAFEHIAEQHPQRVERVFRRLLDDEDFSIEHLYAVLLHFKQPVEGMEDLEADQRLWDAFNGNAGQEPAKARTTKRATPAKKKAAPKATAKPKPKPAAKSTGAARKR